MGNLFLVMHRWQTTENVRLKSVKVREQKIYLLNLDQKFSSFSVHLAPHLSLSTTWKI